MPPPWRQVCSLCGRTWSPADLRWRCRCGGLLDLVGPLADPFGRPDESSPLLRYRDALPPFALPADLGMSITPLAPLGEGLWVKADYAHPTGSFKDRGSSVMLGGAAELGVGAVIVDSSGNAGKAAAAHSRALGVDCTVYLPESTPPAKVTAMAAYGASVVAVPGDRAAAATAAMDAVSPGTSWYASHVHQPAFHHGVKTLAFELFEQLPDLAAATVVVPAGNGTLVLGLWLGFGELVALGRLSRRPVIVAVQAERCAPLAGRPAPEPGPATAAAGIASAHPPRAPHVRAALAASGGRVLTVSEEEIHSAGRSLAAAGHPVEPTGAVAWAAVERVGRGAGPEPVVAVLTGR
jgi:threonine synthase